MEIDHISQKNHQDWSIVAEIMVFFISQRAGWFLVYGNSWLINGFKSKIDKSTFLLIIGPKMTIKGKNQS